MVNQLLSAPRRWQTSHWQQPPLPHPRWGTAEQERAHRETRSLRGPQVPQPVATLRGLGAAFPPSSPGVVWLLLHQAEG